MKKKGKVTERMRINILIRKDNSLIISLRKTVQALTELVITAAKLLIPALADALEGIRVGMINKPSNLTPKSNCSVLSH